MLLPVVYLVCLRARPDPDSKEFGQVGGAFVRAWVRAHSIADAVTRVRSTVEHRGWVVEVEHDALLMTSERVEALDDHDRSMFESAVSSGLAAYFATWPAASGVASDPDTAVH